MEPTIQDEIRKQAEYIRGMAALKSNIDKEIYTLAYRNIKGGRSIDYYYGMFRGTTVGIDRDGPDAALAGVLAAYAVICAEHITAAMGWQ